MKRPFLFLLSYLGLFVTCFGNSENDSFVFTTILPVEGTTEIEKSEEVDSHVLNLAKSKISSLEDEVWKIKEHPRAVNASHNPLKTVGLLHSDTVQLLDLSHGELSWIQAGSLRGLTKLETLKINYNRLLTTIDLDTPSLRVLQAAHCSIPEFSFPSLINIEILDVSYNQIIKLDEKTLNYNTKLQEINFSHNQIEFLDDYTFIRLNNLKKIDLSWNKIAVTDWTMALKSVITLDLSHNNLETIDTVLLRDAQVLNVSHNNLKSIPGELDRLLPNLQILNAASNPIRAIEYINSKSITTLLISECKINEITSNAFNKAPNLQFFDISDNKLIKLEFIKSLSNMSQVILHENPWQCDCTTFPKIEVFCEPDNLLLSDFCKQLEETAPTDEPWFLEAANPVVWAPLVAALVIVFVAFCGIRTCKLRRQERLNLSYDEPIDLISNLPEEELEVNLRSILKRILPSELFTQVVQERDVEKPLNSSAGSTLRRN